MIEAVAEYFSTLFSSFVRQMIVGFGLMFLLGFAVYMLQRWSQQMLSRQLGWKPVVYWTGWLGTPIHEVSHVIVGFLCRIKIHEVKLFEPDPKTGVLGYVRYRVPRLFDPPVGEMTELRYWVPRIRWKELPAVIGTFLMGIAPLFGGSLVLLLVFWLIAPDPDPVFKQAERFSQLSAQSSAGEIAGGFFALLQSLYGAIFSAGLGSWRPWVFLYLAIAIGGHLAPSRADLEGGVVGLLTICVIVLLVDAVALLAGANLAQANKYLIKGTGPLSALLLLAVVVNSVNLALAYLVSRAIRRVRIWRYRYSPI